jgi:hypothetical protein
VKVFELLLVWGFNYRSPLRHYDTLLPRRLLYKSSSIEYRRRRGFALLYSYDDSKAKPVKSSGRSRARLIVVV